MPKIQDSLFEIRQSAVHFELGTVSWVECEFTPSIGTRVTDVLSCIRRFLRRSTQSNGGTPCFSRSYSSSCGARTRRSGELDLRRRQSPRGIRSQSLSLFLQRVSGTHGHAALERPARRQYQGRQLQISPVADRPDGRPRRGHHSRQVSTANNWNTGAKNSLVKKWDAEFKRPHLILLILFYDRHSACPLSTSVWHPQRVQQTQRARLPLRLRQILRVPQRQTP